MDFEMHSFITAIPETGAIKLIKDRQWWFTFAEPGVIMGVALSSIHKKHDKRNFRFPVLVKNVKEEDLLPLKWWAKIPPLSKFFIKERLLPFPFYLWIVGDVNGISLAEVVERGP